jgi:hypothetical protein
MFDRTFFGFVSILVMTIALLSIAFSVKFLHQISVFIVILAAGLESFLALGLIRWSFSRSDKLFYSIYFGGSLFRLLSVGAAAWILHALRQPVATPLLSLVMAYFVLSLGQIPFYRRA